MRKPVRRLASLMEQVARQLGGSVSDLIFSFHG